MSVSLSYLKPNDPLNRNIENQFYSSWQHPNTRTPKIKHIFYLLHQSPHSHAQLLRNRAYMRRLGNEKMLFHGTLRTCQIGDTPGSLYPCNRSDCKLCAILRCSFDPNKSHDGMFGHGVYTTPVSSSKQTRSFLKVDLSIVYRFLRGRELFQEPQLALQSDVIRERHYRPDKDVISGKTWPMASSGRL